ncbi:mitochondrial basic amino acids transporter [Anopheles merus]|uniref:mitochondrial basic amino acids transporter n=1 Tax=Anopheles merus TaxID=30066 RepID=UPI001BE3E4D0|nr:mitochondrial basic amino acids transporter [Anopheles merus]XP_041777461.1 mitochondrial basic amino acids transporter [Anopheles merus]
MALDFAAGCLGGCAGVLVGFPFDTVKVHLQTQNHRNPLYRGTYDCFRKIVVREGVHGLYRGMSSPMAGVAVVNAIVFGVYGNIQRRTANPDSLYSHFLAGSAAGLAQSIVCSPMELIKTRLQLQDNLPRAAERFSGPMDCTRAIWRREGFRGIFRGLGITAARDMPGFSSYFVAYEYMVRCVANPSPFVILMAGGLAGTFSWLVTFPLDVVKSRLQADGISGKPQYNGLIDCVRKSHAAEGWAFLSRGLASTLLRAFPMNAVCFLVVSYTMKLFDDPKISSVVEELGATAATVEPPLLIVPTVVPQVAIATAPKLSVPAPAYNKRASHHDHDSHLLNIKQNTYRFLRSLGAFSEAVCCAEMGELTDDLYDRDEAEQRRASYAKLNELLLSTDPEDTSNRYPFLGD